MLKIVIVMEFFESSTPSRKRGLSGTALKRNADCITITEKADDGLGDFTMRSIFASEAELPARMRLAREVLIRPGEECKSHVHEGHTEICYILSGRAECESAEADAGDGRCRAVFGRSSVSRAAMPQDGFFQGLSAAPSRISVSVSLCRRNVS